MDLREELARQSLLLEFIAECVTLSSVDEIVRLVTRRLHWICDYDACSLLLPDHAGLSVFSQDRRAGASVAIADPGLLALHRSLQDTAMVRGAPSLADRAQTALFVVASPLGTRTTVLGALSLSRASLDFSHGDLRHLQHASSAVGGALVRIAAITAEHDAERAIKGVESQLRSAAEDRALLAEQMIGIVSHDLRNPLSAILMGSSVMALGDPLPPQKELVLRKIQNATRRAQRLVEELLDFTQARVGRGLVLKIREVDVDELIASTVQELILTFPGMKLERDTSGLGSARLDADRVQQLIGNLIANAVKYGLAGHPIQLGCRMADGHLALSVTNQGEPVPAALLATMFEPMVRGAGQGSENRSVGLGLYIVRAIAEAHGGSVDVTSDRADGTTVTARLPVGPLH